MPTCAAPNCNSDGYGIKGLQYHRFPANLERRMKWLQNCRRKDWIPTQNARLCSLHFDEFQYEQNRADGKRRLIPFALPTLFADLDPPQFADNKKASLRAQFEQDHAYGRKPLIPLGVREVFNDRDPLKHPLEEAHFEQDHADEEKELKPLENPTLFRDLNTPQLLKKEDGKDYFQLHFEESEVESACRKKRLQASVVPTSMRKINSPQFELDEDRKESIELITPVIENRTKRIKSSQSDTKCINCTKHINEIDRLKTQIEKLVKENQRLRKENKLFSSEVSV